MEMVLYTCLKLTVSFCLLRTVLYYLLCLLVHRIRVFVEFCILSSFLHRVD